MNLYYKYNAANCMYHMLWDDLLQIWHLEQKHPDFNLIFDDIDHEKWRPDFFPRMPNWIDWIKLVKKKNIIKLSEISQKDFDYNLQLTKSMDIKYEIEPKSRYSLWHGNSWHNVHTDYNLTDFSNTILESLNVKRNPNPQNYIFVNRECGTRSVVNALEVVEQLNKAGLPFTYHKLEDTDLSWQAKLFNNAKWVISPEGSNGTHAMFMEPNSKLTTIFPEDYRWESYQESFCKFYDLEYHCVKSLPFSDACISPNHKWCFNKLNQQIDNLDQKVNYEELYHLKGLFFHGCHISGDYPEEVINNRWLKNAVKNQNMIVDYKTIQ